MDTYTEKRKELRVEVNLPLKIKATKSSLSNFKAKALNLSEGGVKLALEKEIDIPKSLILDFEATSPLRRVKANSDLIWNNGTYYGMRFRDLEEEQAKNLRRILWQNESYIEKNINDLLNKVKPLMPGMGNLIRNFFVSDMHKYLEKIELLYSEIIEKKVSEDKGQIEIDRETNKIAEKGSSLEQILDSKIFSKEIKSIFRSMVGSWIYESKYLKRGFEKPRGYPGDYKMIEAIYDNKPRSEGIGRYLDSFFLNNSYAGAVRNRKDKIVDILDDFLKKADSPIVRILNLASGSCREIKELFEKISKVEKEVKFTCIDHDEEALDFAQEALKSLPKKAQVKFVKENILTMPERQKYYAELLGGQNLIYSLGLIDYVPDRILKRLIKLWFNLLAPEGRMLLTHKDIDRDPLAPLAPDWYCNWKFVPRNEAYFINLVKDSIEDNHSLVLSRDASRKIIFLFVDKK